jgi:hypothetical protein
MKMTKSRMMWFMLATYLIGIFAGVLIVLEAAPILVTGMIGVFVGVGIITVGVYSENLE